MYNNAQLGFYLPWDGEITVGVNNIFEEEIQFYSGGQAWRGFDYFLYNPDGRSWWVKYEQNF
jgi:outer membrane receptor for ferrienterochelin and colicin